MKQFASNKWVLLIILALTWGTSFILIKKGVEQFSPLLVGSLRMSFAGLFFVFFSIPHFQKIPKNKWGWMLLSGMLGNFIPMFLFPLAETTISSALAGILNSTVPIFTVIFGFLFFSQSSSFRQILGVLIGFLGTYFILSQNITISHLFSYTQAALIVLLAASMYAMSGLIIKKHLSGIPSLALSSVLFTLLAIPALVIVGLNDIFSFDFTPAHWQSLICIAILGVMGTAIAMFLFYKLIKISSAVFASTVTYLMPIVALLWGFLANESITLNQILGGGIILIGVLLIHERKK